MGNFSFSANGVWIISYYLAGLVSSAPNASFGLWSYSSPYVSSSAPFVTTNNGTAPNINSYACGSIITNSITTTVTFSMFLNIYSGSIYTNNGSSYVVATRLA